MTIRRLFLKSASITSFLAAASAVAYGLVLRCSSLGRSLWLDEAWVANSVSTRSLKGMFYYDAWLQSSPPLFLLLVKNTVAVFGLRNTALRLVPLAMGILTIVLMLSFAMRIVSSQYALLAGALLALSPVAVDYSRLLKQYSTELAASSAILLACSLYIEKTTARRFWALVATVSVGLLSGYAIAFFLPGIAFLLWMAPIRPGDPSHISRLEGPLTRALVFTAIAGGILAGEYVLFVLPNSPEILRSQWSKKNARVESLTVLAASDAYQFVGELPLNHRLQRQGIRVGVVGFTLIMGLALAWLRFRKGRYKSLEIQVVCLLPCLLLIVSDCFNWYPFTDRTSLFALPCLIALLVSALQLMSLLLLKLNRDWIRPLLSVLILGAIVLTLIAGRAKNYRIIGPVEDMDGAVSFLRAHVQPKDFLYVHASTSEAFKLYATMRKWTDPPARFGRTSWPCCARGVTEYGSSEELVRGDFGAALPAHPSGKVWLLYTARPEHWQLNIDEPRIMQTILDERGCVETPAAVPAFYNVGVAVFDCGSQGVAPAAFR